MPLILGSILRWSLRVVMGLGAGLVMLQAQAGEGQVRLFRPNEVVLFQGDSITDGNRGRNADPNHILGHGYVFSIASRNGATFPNDGLTFLNRGISGNTVADLTSRWDTDTLALSPTVLSILVGINDINGANQQHQKFDAATYEQGYDSLLARTIAALPKVRLVLCEPFTLDVGKTMGDYATRRQAVDDAGRAVERLAIKYHCPAVRFQKAFDEASQIAPADHWIWDGIHPTYSGHAIMDRAWTRAYRDFYISPVDDPDRNSAIAPVVNFERDSYDWLHRHDDTLDAQKKGNPAVVMIGDSITHFWGGNAKGSQAHGPKSWNQAFGSLKVLNMGCGWDRTQNVLWRLENGEFLGVSPKSVVINIGTNNLVGDSTARTNSPEEIVAGIQKIVEVISERSPSTQIFVMGVFPRGYEKDNPLDLSIRRLNSLLGPSLASKPKVTFLDIGAKMRNPDGSIVASMFLDGTHPTEQGYKVWGDALKSAGVLPE